MGKTGGQMCKCENVDPRRYDGEMYKKEVMQEKVNVSYTHNLKAYFYQHILIHTVTQCILFYLRTAGLSADMCSKQEHDSKVMIKHQKTDVLVTLFFFKLQGFQN